MTRRGRPLSRRSVLSTLSLFALSACTCQSRVAGRATPRSGSGATPEERPPGNESPLAPSPAPAPEASRGGDAIDAPTIRAGGDHVAPGTAGMVTSVEDHATRAGVDVLEAGGNAVDAAVAAGYALAVTHPSAGNIGGGGFMLVRRPGDETVAIDFREQAPRAVTQDRFDAMIARGARGPEAVGVPGTVAGLNLAHERFGKLPLARVLAPAIALGERGFELGRRQALTIRWSWPFLRHDRAARETFGRNGRPRRAGERLTRPHLARTLARIAEHGNAGFYDGPVAASIEKVMTRSGLITRDDLLRYEARVREPLTLRYRGLTVEVAPPPSAGGVAVLQMLAMLEHFRAHEIEPMTAESLHLFIEVAKRAHATRRFDVVDPSSVDGYDLAAKARQWLDVERVLAGTPPIDPKRATPSAKIHPLFDAAMKELEHNTTHFSVTDAEGTAVSCTTTLSAGFGAKFVVPSTGIVMNNSLAAFGTVGADVVAPDRRMTSSMSPTLLLVGTETAAVLGSPGGDTIPNTVVQVLRHLVDHGMTLDRAVDAPRIHHGFAPDRVRYERARPIPKAVRDALRARGHVFSDKTIDIGDANSIVIGKTSVSGYADPREGGLASGPAAKGDDSPQ